MRRMSVLLATLLAACATRTSTGSSVPSTSRGVLCYELLSLAVTDADEASRGRRTLVDLAPAAIPGSHLRRGTILGDGVGAPQIYDLFWWTPRTDSLRMSTLTYPQSDYHLRRAADGGWLGRRSFGSDAVTRGQQPDTHVDSVSLIVVDCPAGVEARPAR
jgi:hypothetical protein